MDLKYEYAKKLIKESKLTISQGAELSEISVVEFLLRLSSEGIPVIDYSTDELVNEVKSIG